MVGLILKIRDEEVKYYLITEESVEELGLLPQGEYEIDTFTELEDDDGARQTIVGTIVEDKQVFIFLEDVLVAINI